MYDQNGFDSSGNYRYNCTQPPQGGDPWDRPQPPVPSQPPKKKGGAGRAVALVLCCAIAGGGAGLGGAAAYSHLNRAPQNETTIYRNEVDPTAVNVKQADGLTPMSLAEINAAYADACVCISVRSATQQGWSQ